MNIKAIGKALRNKAGAPGRAFGNRNVASNKAKSDKEVGFLKDYNAKQKSRVPVTPKERSQFDMMAGNKTFESSVPSGVNYKARGRGLNGPKN